jgi:DNA polymerase-3 subunit gamma/tau
MLRTFDELGYRQEQRFHFELGLLKLVHLRRLLPIEEVLSQFPVGGGSGQVRGTTAKAVGAPATPAKGVAGTAAVRAVEASAALADTKPAFSPFEQDKNRRRFEEKAPVTAYREQPVPIAAPMPVPAAVPVPISMATPDKMVLTEGDAVGAKLIEVGDLAELGNPGNPGNHGAAEQPVAEAQNESAEDLRRSQSHSAEGLQKASVDALIKANNQDTAADALGDAEWVVAGGEVRVQTELSKTMLPMVINAEAEKLIKAALRDAGAGALKLVLLPGVKSATAAKKPKAAKAGSAQAMAMEHPIVQRAQTLFNAEIQSVIDLRDND